MKLFALSALILVNLPSVLQPQSRAQEDLVRPSLFVTSSSFDESFDIGLRFMIEPEWYLYWLNPGDAGLSVEVSWNLPQGWTAGPVRFPTPEKIVKGGITAFGYHDELVLLCRITPGEDDDAAPEGAIRLTVDWLVCKESCLPGRAELVLLLVKDQFARSLVEPDRLQRYQDRFPQSAPSAGIEVAPPKYHHEGRSTMVTIPLSGRAVSGVSDFFPELVDGFSIDLTSIRVNSDGIHMRMTPHSSSSVLRSIRGIAIVDGKGYELKASFVSE